MKAVLFAKDAEGMTLWQYTVPYREEAALSRKLRLLGEDMITPRVKEYVLYVNVSSVSVTAHSEDWDRYEAKYADTTIRRLLQQWRKPRGGA